MKRCKTSRDSRRTAMSQEPWSCPNLRTGLNVRNAADFDLPARPPARHHRRSTFSLFVLSLVQRSHSKTTSMGLRMGRCQKAPPVTGNTMSDGQYAGVMLVSDHLFAAIAVGDILTVVNTPFNRSAPRLVSEVRGFDPTSTYAWIMASLLLSLLFAGVAMRISKAKTTTSGSTPVGGSIENPNRALK
jgi:hypothetical protein